MGGLEKRCRCRTADEKTRCRCPTNITSWRASYYHAGRQIKATFPRKQLAERWLADQESAKSRGEHVDPRDGLLPFVDWATEWAQSREAVLKQSTYLAEKGRLNKHVVPFFGTRPLNQVTPALVRKWVAQLDIAPKTIRHCHALLHAIMADAVSEGLIGRNPCVGTRLPEVIRREMVCLTPQQLEQLYDEIPDHYRPLVVLLALTGLRWGEAVGLKVGRVDLLAGNIRVEETLAEPHGKVHWTSPKTRASRRQVRIPRRVVDELLPLVAGKASGEPVFLTRQGNLIRGRMFRDQLWLPTLERLGWHPRPRVHDLRHSHVAHLIASGVPITAIQRRLGHTSISVTSDVYGHLLPSVEDNIVAVLDAGYETPADPRDPMVIPQEKTPRPN